MSEQRQGFSFLSGILFLCFDMFFYLFLALYLHQVLPNNSGVRKHPLFCFMKAAEEEAVISHQEVESSNAHLIEPVSSELLATDSTKAVHIRNLCKNYVAESGVVQALDNLSLDMYQGETVFHRELYLFIF